MYRLFIYSLRDDNSKTYVSIHLGLKILSTDRNKIKIQLPSGIKEINYWEYLNQDKVYQDPDDSKMFFMICNKQVKSSWALRSLLKYAIQKTRSRIDNMNALISKYQNEIVAA